MHDNLHYNKHLQPNANRLRHSLTNAEACLWKYVLKARQLKGYQFRRQRPVSKYVVDFLCKELKLIIEVDGYTHTFAEIHDHDIERQNKLELLGFYVFRVQYRDVLNNIYGLRQELETVIDGLEKKDLQS
jgi:very-short-patch-repair endonuclease